MSLNCLDKLLGGVTFLSVVSGAASVENSVCCLSWEGDSLRGEGEESDILCSSSLPPRTRLAYTAFMRMSPKGISVAVSGVMLFRIRCWKGIIIRNGFILEEIHNMTAI